MGLRVKEKGKTKMKEQNSRTKGQRGAVRVSKERFKFPRPCYVILDPKGEYFRDFTGSTPAALHSFTDSFFNAWKLYDPDEARELKKRVLRPRCCRMNVSIMPVMLAVLWSVCGRSVKVKRVRFSRAKPLQRGFVV